MPQQKPTGALLKQLRALMQNVKYVNEPLHAYIVPSCDAHHSEYLAEHDQRRAFISGFTGSAGTAIITNDNAYMWTDGRYYLQANQEMDSNWTLMKEGLPTTPSQGTWLSDHLPNASRVGVDPKLMAYHAYVPLQTQLEASGHKLVPVGTNLIDLIWEDKPPADLKAVVPLPLQFSGKPVSEKVEEVRKQMKIKHASVLVLTALDEIAWFLNLRGSDIEYNPVFFSYVIVTTDSVLLLLHPQQVSSEIEQHLASEAKSCNVQVCNTYETVLDVLKKVIENTSGHVWISDYANYALSSVVPPKRLKHEITPVALMKAVKNPVEIKGMRNAHIKDAAALCCYFSWLEKAIQTQKVTEISGAQKLDEFRKLQADYVGMSFATISSVGPHGAIIHYHPEESTDVPITNQAIYLCDSGGQYRDGTTDVTRTFHFGNPTKFEKECYTRVLKGQLKLAASVFPAKIKGNCLDSFARQYLWEVGLDYAHGTGHGIGAYLNVHEGPMGVSWRSIPEDPGLEAGMFISNEPGYYEDGQFGLRIEDIVQIVPAEPPHNFNSRGFLTFETITLVPKQIKLIQIDMLTQEEIEALNSYHKKCRDIVGPLLEAQGQLEAKEWLWRETETIIPSMELNVCRFTT